MSTISIEDVAVPLEHLPGLLSVAAEKAKRKRRPYQLVEFEPGKFRIISGYAVWTEKVRAYIDQAGNIAVSDYAKVRFGFELPWS